MMDMSHDMIKRCREMEENSSDSKLETLYVVGDEEYLPIKHRWIPSINLSRLVNFLFLSMNAIRDYEFLLSPFIAVARL